MSRARTLAYGLSSLLAFAVVGLAAGCGQPASTCSSDNCAGCCKGTTCVLNTTDANCGVGGEVCSSCADDEACSDEGVCAPAVSCLGCIDAANKCVTGNSANACGGGGNECATCGGGKVCTDGLCVAATCTGCLSGTTCEIGNLKDKCGKGGKACQVCMGTENCQDRECTGPIGICNATTNPTGCCDMTGSPQVGNTVTACGTGGMACSTCTGTGATCENGVCKKPCGADCVGCCDASGMCRPSITATCGVSGSECKDCTGVGPCSDGQCVPAACAMTCVGCCSGTGADACKQGNTIALCGGGGESCKACAVGQICGPGGCAPDPNAKWDFIILSAVVEPFEPDNTNWDISTPPDPYLQLIADPMGTPVKYYSAYVNNTTTPDYASAVVGTYSKKVMNNVTAAQIAKVYYWRMFDVDSSVIDPSWDDDMGQCAIAIGAGAYSGATYVASCPAAKNTVGSKWTVNFKIVPHT